MTMSPALEQVREAAMNLSEDDRRELVEALLASLLPSDRPPFDESWREVIQRRSEELRTGKVCAVPWEEVKRRAREQTGG
jgi:putative addiction module component (TIGR02574 family)